MKITKISLLVDLYLYYKYCLSSYSKDFDLLIPRDGCETHYNEAKEKLAIIDELLGEAEEKENNLELKGGENT